MALIESEKTQLETINTQVYDNADVACNAVADAITQLIAQRNAENKPAVLGLATGSTPVRLYRELIRRHREEGLSFANVVTFNLDEYYGLKGDHPESYRKFMQDQLFDHVDIKFENTNVPDGTVARESVFDSCKAYEDAIQAAGGIDIQILGIGRTGHIGFNEPGSGPETRTRMVTLDGLTRRDAARDFLGEKNVPRHAITMGVGTILDARQVFLLAWGEGKASIITKTVEGTQTDTIPATFLQLHDQCTFCIDTAAASHLTRQRYPWLVGTVEWTDAMTRKAVLWLSQKVEKPILKLREDDYAEHGMSDLLIDKGSTHQLNTSLFERTQQTISNQFSTTNGKSEPCPQRCLILSPEPLDDVYCMGGTIGQLKEQGYEVTIAYQTSGNLAVPDNDVRNRIESMIALANGQNEPIDVSHAKLIEEQLNKKGLFGSDTREIRHFKGLIRRSEARSSTRLLDLDPEALKFMNLPFYENGRYRRFMATDADFEQMILLLEHVKPHKIFATGYGHDPLSVSALCYSILRTALERSAESEWIKDCKVWLYKGAEKEWEADEIDIAVPLSPDELENKLQAIYQHQTQRKQTVEAGSKNTWDFARETNQGTAKLYDSFGLAEYEAIECFKQLKA